MTTKPLTEAQREAHRIANRKWKAKLNDERQLAKARDFDLELQRKVRADPNLWPKLRESKRRHCEGCGRWCERVVYAGWWKGLMRYGALCRFCAADWVLMGGSAVVRFAKAPAGSTRDERAPETTTATQSS